MNRRRFLKGLGGSLGAAAFSGCNLFQQPGRARPGQPNIILIMADDVGVEAFGSYGGTSYKTPVLDRLAEEGVRFTHCFSQPLCTPSRVKLMTGKSNIRNYSHFSILEPGEGTFGHLLSRAGYRTAVAGKWQLYGTDKYGELEGAGTHPVDAGFHEYCLWQIDRLGSRYWDPCIERNGRLLDDTKGKYGPDLFCDFILDFMEQHRHEPFALYYPMALVHNPFVSTPLSGSGSEKSDVRNFGDMVFYMDRLMGRIIERLEELGLRENTLFLFTSDNGTNKKIRSTTVGDEVQGGKGETTDAGTRVPLIANWPGRTPRGSVCDDLVDFSDFFPTLAEAAGTDCADRPGIDGHSFLPQILGRPGHPREWIFCYYYPRPNRENTREQRFARDHRFKLYGDGRLYDLERDPKEEHPLLDGETGPEAAAARSRLKAAMDSFPERPLKIKVLPDPPAEGER